MEIRLVVFLVLAIFGPSSAAFADDKKQISVSTNCPATPCKINLTCFKLTVSLKYESGVAVPNAQGALHRANKGQPTERIGILAFENGVAEARLCTDLKQQIHIRASTDGPHIYGVALAVLDRDFEVQFIVPNP